MSIQKPDLTEFERKYQRQYEELGLGSEEERAAHRFYRHDALPGRMAPVRKPEKHRTIRWFTDEREMELYYLENSRK